MPMIMFLSQVDMCSCTADLGMKKSQPDSKAVAMPLSREPCQMTVYRSKPSAVWDGGSQSLHAPVSAAGKQRHGVLCPEFAASVPHLSMLQVDCRNFLHAQVSATFLGTVVYLLLSSSENLWLGPATLEGSSTRPIAVYPLARWP